MRPDIIARLELSKKISMELFNWYNGLSGECYEERKYEEYDYWLDRSAYLVDHLRWLDKEIKSLKGEA